MQAPTLHAGTGMWFDEQTWPQPPQLFGSVPVATSQPSVRLLLLQSVKPWEQLPASHDPDAQMRAIWLVEHACPQPPQLSEFVLTLISQPSVRLLPLQSLKPELQTPDSHEPPEQTRAMLDGEQAAPQEPQLAESDCRFCALLVPVAVVAPLATSTDRTVEPGTGGPSCTL